MACWEPRWRQSRGSGTFRCLPTTHYPVACSSILKIEVCIVPFFVAASITCCISSPDLDPGHVLQIVRNMTAKNKGGIVKTFIKFRVSSHVGTPVSITLNPVPQTSLNFSVQRITNHKSQAQTATIKSNTDFSKFLL